MNATDDPVSDNDNNINNSSGRSFFLFHAVNIYVTTLIAVVVNSLLLFYAVTEKGSVLRGYRRMIVAVCLMEFFYTLCMSLGQYQFEFSRGVALGVVTSPLRHAGYGMVVVAAFMYITALGTASTTILMEFRFRYLLICRGEPMSIRTIFLCVVVGGTYSMFDAALVVTEAVRTDASNYSFVIDRFPAWREQDGSYMPYLAIESFSFRSLSLAVFGSILVFGSFGMSLYYGYAVYRHLQCEKHLFSTKTKKMQNGMNRVMFTQATLTFINCSLPVGFMFYGLISYAHHPWLGTIAVCMTHWIPVINPIAYMIFIKPFRIRFLAVGRRRLSSITGPQPSWSHDFHF